MALVSRVGVGTRYERDFDQGSFAAIEGTSSIRITPVKHWNSQWAWWAVRSNELGGATPTFLIAKADHLNMAAGERLCCWAIADDTDAWNDFDNVTIGETDLEFSNDSAFPAGVIYVAALPLYPFSRVQRKVAQWMSYTSRVSDTTSSTDGVIDAATPRSAGDGSGRTAPALSFYGFKITGDRVGNKNKAILSSFNHPSETPGVFAFESAVDWLLSGAANAETLLDWFEFYVYPCTNPQGVWAGYFRSCPEDATRDHNREWDANDLECTTAFRAAMTADTGGTIDVGLDYHSYYDNTDIHGNVQSGDTGGNYGYFNTEMQTLDADFNLLEENITTSLRYLWKDTYSASLAMSIEQGLELARGVAEYKTYGENTMKALYELLNDGRFTYGP